jgi:hypothetical protein
MSKRSIIIGWLLSVALALAGGLYLGRGQVEVREVLKEVEGKTKIVEVEKIITVTVVKQPDGTTTTTTKTEDKKKDTQVSNKSTDKSSTKSPALAQWGVGGGISARFGQFPLKPEYYGSVSRRVLGPVWVEGQGSIQSASIGVRLEF